MKEAPCLTLSLEECEALFSRLKVDEQTLPEKERLILRKIEKALYSALSIREVEDLCRSKVIRPAGRAYEA